MANLLFKSGFETGVTLTGWNPAGGFWKKLLHGSDEPGFDWDTYPTLPGQLNHLMSQVEATPPAPYIHPIGEVPNYVDSEIQSVTGHTGDATKALYYNLKKQDELNATGTRLEYGFFPPISMVQGYLSMWVKFQDNLLTTVMVPGSSPGRNMQLGELRFGTSPSDTDYRVSWSMVVNNSFASLNPVWKMSGQYGDVDASPDIAGSPFYNSTDQIPDAAWCLAWHRIRIFWKRGLTDGRVKFTIDNSVLFDYTGVVGHTGPGLPQNPASISVWWPFKVYFGGSNALNFATNTGVNPVSVWYDDFELWDDEPMETASPWRRQGMLAVGGDYGAWPAGTRKPVYWAYQQFIAAVKNFSACDLISQTPAAPGTSATAGAFKFTIPLEGIAFRIAVVAWGLTAGTVDLSAHFPGDVVVQEIVTALGASPPYDPIYPTPVTVAANVVPVTAVPVIVTLAVP